MLVWKDGARSMQRANRVRCGRVSCIRKVWAGDRNGGGRRCGAALSGGGRGKG
jgi:hypothetical protein